MGVAGGVKLGSGWVLLDVAHGVYLGVVRV